MLNLEMKITGWQEELNNKPTPEQIKAFIFVFEKLSDFDAQQRHMRGYGAFTKAEIITLPMGVVKVLNWLKEQAGVNEN